MGMPGEPPAAGLLDEYGYEIAHLISANVSCLRCTARSISSVDSSGNCFKP
jgi:hypothetical protein